MREDYLRYAAVDISPLLEGETPRLIDEWQDAPQFWDAIRYRVDHSDKEGLFVLTGSSVVPKEKEDKILHSGTGRIARLRMRPMSLWESCESSGGVSIGALFRGECVAGTVRAKPYGLREIAYLICRGGWPRAVNQGGDIALERAFDYVDAVVNSDISRTGARVCGRARRFARLIRDTSLILPLPLPRSGFRRVS